MTDVYRLLDDVYRVESDGPETAWAPEETPVATPVEAVVEPAVSFGEVPGIDESLDAAPAPMPTAWRQEEDDILPRRQRFKLRLR